MINSTNTVISAQDYDSWGYLLPNRSYNINDMKYDYTSKERDNETSYDYFGARYYDSRIGRWGQIEPLLDNFAGITPYNYVLNNPIKITDEDGNWPRDEQKIFWQTPVEQISGAWLALKDRFNSSIDNISNGNLGMGILGMSTLPTLSLSLIPVNPLSDFIMPLGTFSNKFTTLFRAVGENEYSNILRSGKYMIKEGGVEGKYFWLNKKDMEWFIKNVPGNKKYVKTKIKIRSSLLKGADVNFEKDAGHPFVFIGKETLHKFSSSAIQTMMDFSKIQP